MPIDAISKALAEATGRFAVLELLVGALLSEASEAHDVPSDFIMTITESIRAAIQESDANQSLLAGMESTLDAIQARALGPISDGHN